MKVPYGEGLANHTGPESCVWARKGAGEALTGEVRAGLLSRERYGLSFRVPTPSTSSEGNTDYIARARCDRTLRGQRPRARTEAPHAGTGRSHVWSSGDGTEARAVNPKGARQR
jgi:hypothetical protein